MKNNARPEILAPAGSEQALLAALRCGADAVYLGMGTLNARRNAANFDETALRQAVFDCHARGVKAYLTLNTLVRDMEQSEVLRVLETACSLAADAVIVQDLAVARLVRAAAPTLPLHASTQISVQTAAGLERLAKLGFCRAVLPRELSRAELEALAKNAPMELEIFVHGALCASVSGQCLMSAVFGGRSGNRGLCAQPCRLPFSFGGIPNALSLKDLSLLDALPELAAMGIRSFKIEGRMKRPEYVAAAVTACKQALSGALQGEKSILREQLRAAFSRSGFTQGYDKGERGAELFGTRQKEDVLAAQKALPTLARLYQTEKPCIALHICLRVRQGEAVCLTVKTRNKTVSLYGAAAQAARKQAVSQAVLRKQLEKCGGTPFYAEEIEIDLAPDVFLSLAEVNSLRRQALRELEQVLAKRDRLPFCPPKEEKMRRSFWQKPLWDARFTHWRQFAQIESVPLPLRRVILPLHTPESVFQRLREEKIVAAVEIPRGIFGAENAVLTQLCQAKTNGAQLAVAGTLDGLALAQKAGLPVSAGFGMHVMNTQTLAALAEMGVTDAVLSCELSTAQIRDLGGTLPRGVFVYGALPLMLLRNCPQPSRANCTNCAGELRDRKGSCFPLQCVNGVREVLNDRPLYMADRLGQLQTADYFLLYFTKESPEDCRKILCDYRDGNPPQGVFTRGLLNRGVL